MGFRRSFQNKIRDDWREDAKQGGELLPRNYNDRVELVDKPKMHKTIPRSGSQAEIMDKNIKLDAQLHRCKYLCLHIFHYFMIIDPYQELNSYRPKMEGHGHPEVPFINPLDPSMGAYMSWENMRIQSEIYQREMHIAMVQK